MSFPSSLLIFCRSLALAVFLSLGLSIIVHAQTAKLPVEVCGDKGSQADMNDCASREAQKAEAELDSTYRELINKIIKNKTATVKVIAAEKAWIAFRDAELAAEWPVGEGEDANLLYGSVHPFCYLEERTAMTLDRVNTLKALMTYEEGDVCGSGLASRQSPEQTPRRCHAAADRTGIPAQ